MRENYPLPTIIVTGTLGDYAFDNANGKFYVERTGEFYTGNTSLQYPLFAIAKETLRIYPYPPSMIVSCLYEYDGRTYDRRVYKSTPLGNMIIETIPMPNQPPLIQSFVITNSEYLHNAIVNGKDGFSIIRGKIIKCSDPEDFATLWAPAKKAFADLDSILAGGEP